jgi:hypothetical protein
MAVTQLQRKNRKNHARAKNRKVVIKQLTRKPIIKNVDVEAIKASFKAKKEAEAAANAK